MNICLSVHVSFLFLSTTLIYYPIRLVGGTPFPGLDRGSTPAGLDRGVPHPADGGGTPPVKGAPPWQGVCPHQGVPPTRVPPPPDQHSVNLLRSGRCASCVDAGGLSCCRCDLHEVLYVCF